MHDNPLVLGPVFIPLFFAVLSLGLARINNNAQRYTALLGSSLAMICTLAVLAQNWEIAQANDGRVAVQVYRMGGWQPPYGIVLTADLLSSIFAAMSAIVVTAGIFICGAMQRPMCELSGVYADVFVHGWGIARMFLYGRYFHAIRLFWS